MSVNVAATTGLAITNPLIKYRALIATKTITPDPAQYRLAIHLSKLYDRLKDYEPEIEYSHKLDAISRSLQDASREIREPDEPPHSRPSSAWRSLFTINGQDRHSTALTRYLTSHETALNLDSPKGLLLHGEVGTGKSMLVDLFADSLPNRKKRRMHFNTFMLEIFARLEGLRQQREAQLASSLSNKRRVVDDEYPLLWLAKEMITRNPILFLDEFQMPDRVASKVLTNLMTAFFQLGGVLLATSNRMPEELDKAAGIAYSAAPPSLSRSLAWQLGLAARPPQPSSTAYGNRPGNEFGKFLEVLKARCDVWEMEGGKDYRRMESGGLRIPVQDIDQDGLEELRVDDIDNILHRASLINEATAQNSAMSDSKATAQDGDVKTSLPIHYAVMDGAEQALDQLKTAITAVAPDTPTAGDPGLDWPPTTLIVYGRTITIPHAWNGVCIWTFAELCQATFGPADYISLASAFHTIIITDVPVLNWLMKNEARRFITLLDALYECRCKLFVSAAAGPDDIFFPDEHREARNTSTREGDSSDAVYSETMAEVYQDATAPFRPNVLSSNPNYAEPDPEPDYTHARLAGLLNADSLEDDPPNRPREAGSRRSSPFGRSFGMTGPEMERKPVDPDDTRYTSALANGQRPDFQRTDAFTGDDERFAYKRAQSRLWEMCSARWWARNEADWHRPLPSEVRRWERSVTSQSSPSHTSSSEQRSHSDIQMGAAVEDSSRDPRSFKSFEKGREAERDGGGGGAESGAAKTSLKSKGSIEQSEGTSFSPFRKTAEPPPRFSWTHIWGLIKWGPKAGIWGQGPEGLQQRRDNKKS